MSPENPACGIPAKKPASRSAKTGIAGEEKVREWLWEGENPAENPANSRTLGAEGLPILWCFFQNFLISANLQNQRISMAKPP